MIDDDIGMVLQSAGRRERPPVEIERAVRSQLRAEWHAMVADAQRHRRHRTGFALAAGILAAAVGVWIAAPQLSGPAQQAGTLAFAAGEVRVRSGWFDEWQAASGGQTLVSGQSLQTGAAGRSVLTLAGGATARLDHDTIIKFEGADRVVLERGALYVDAGTDPSRAMPLDVLTPSGSVRHVGTQYEVRLLGSDVRLRVREGRIAWQARDGAVMEGSAGEQLVISDDGSVARAPAPAYGESWDWIAAATPAIDIEGLPLADFLNWAARELGRELVYTSPGIEQDVAGIVVHGSISGLTPMQALDAVLGTTSVRAAIVDGRILVGAQDAAFQPSSSSSAANPAT